jgi:hypothetical protein
MQIRKNYAEPADNEKATEKKYSEFQYLAEMCEIPILLRGIQLTHVQRF